MICSSPNSIRALKISEGKHTKKRVLSYICWSPSCLMLMSVKHTHVCVSAMDGISHINRTDVSVTLAQRPAIVRLQGQR